MSAIILREKIVHYEVLGRGRPVVFLHGWVGSWRYWIPSMQAISVSYRTYALDFWGFGDTAWSEQYYSLEGQVGLLEEFLDELGIGRVALVGHGLGAVIGLLFALRRPGVVDRVMAASFPQRDGTLHPRLRSPVPAELADWLLARGALSRNPAAEPARLEASKTDPRALALTTTSLLTSNLPDLPAQTAAPCLLVYGGSDPAVPLPTAEQLQVLPDRAHGVIFDGCGHFPMLDEPGKFNRLLVDFLSLPSGESPRQLQLKEEWKRRVR